MQENITSSQPSAVAAAVAEFLKGHLKAGEIYVGLVLNDAGIPDHHLILLPGDVEMEWAGAMAWAAEAGGDLPTRAEQALLFANAKQHFNRDWYWSNTQHADDDGYAWGQSFDGGGQDGSHESVNDRARAVRRLPI